MRKRREKVLQWRKERDRLKTAEEPATSSTTATSVSAEAKATIAIDIKASKSAKKKTWSLEDDDDDDDVANMTKVAKGTCTSISWGKTVFNR